MVFCGGSHAFSLVTASVVRCLTARNENVHTFAFIRNSIRHQVPSPINPKPSREKEKKRKEKKKRKHQSKLTSISFFLSRPHMKPLHESLRSACVADPSLTPLTPHNPRWKVRPALWPPHFQPGADDVHSHQPHPGSAFIVLSHHQCVSVDCCAEVCFLCREELATQSSISHCKRNT